MEPWASLVLQGFLVNTGYQGRTVSLDREAFLGPSDPKEKVDTKV